MSNKEELRNYVYSNARQLDIAFWEYRFELGDSTKVLDELVKYQNEDGGFGNGIEPDFLNPNSSPIATWFATEYIRKISNIEKSHPIITGIFKYLESESSFDGEMWMNVIPSNNMYPHAIWWECKEGIGVPSLNPSASLIAFIFDYADNKSSLYDKARLLAIKYTDYYLDMDDFNIDPHLTYCVRQMCDSFDGKEIIDEKRLEKLKNKIISNVLENLERNIDKWGIDYCFFPSMFIANKKTFLYNSLKDFISKEVTYINDSKLNTMAYSVTWQWWTDYKEFEASKKYWLAIFITNKLIFVEEFSSQ